MQNSTVQVVGIDVVDSFTAHSCLFLVVMASEVDLRMSFHDLCDASSKVLQQSHEVIDLICLHQSDSLAFIEPPIRFKNTFTSCLGESLIRVDVHDILNPFPCEGHEAILAMIAFHYDLQEERIGHLRCCDVMHGINNRMHSIW